MFSAQLRLFFLSRAPAAVACGDPPSVNRRCNRRVVDQLPSITLCRLTTMTVGCRPAMIGVQILSMKLEQDRGGVFFPNKNKRS